MGAKFTCDSCGKEITTAFYDPFEGWQSTGTIEWWEDGKPHKEGYHINLFCGREYDYEKKDYSEDNCYDKFMQENNIVWQTSEMNYGGGHYVQKKI